MNSPEAFQIFLPYARSNQRNKANEYCWSYGHWRAPEDWNESLIFGAWRAVGFAASALRLRASRSMKMSACGHTNVSVDVFA
jgi:hypothetical protein